MPYRAWLLLAALAALALSAIEPYDRGDFALEHMPTIALLSFLIWYERRPGGRPLGNTAYTLLFLFLLLHILGAHYLYSRVPYDAWGTALFGTSLSALFHTTRNHYDRFVHLAFGLLVLLPIAELTRRHVTTTRIWSIVVAIAFVGVLSKLYELAEWLIAIVMSPEAAEAYNGQQGDLFDAQKDMALALVGSLLGSPFVARYLQRHPPSTPRTAPPPP